MGNTIRSLDLSNFTSHRDTTIGFHKPISLIVGPNGSGKTSIKDAIEFALTGACRSTDAGGRGHASLITTGADEMVVTLLLARPTSGGQGQQAHTTATSGKQGPTGDSTPGEAKHRPTGANLAPQGAQGEDGAGAGQMLVRRSADATGTTLAVDGMSGNRTMQQKALLSRLGTSGMTEAQVHAILNSTYFFRLSAREQKGLLFDALDLELTPESVLGFVQSEDAKQIIRLVLDGIPAELKRGHVLIDNMYRALRDARRDAKAMLKTVTEQAKTAVSNKVTEGVKVEDLPKLRTQLRKYQEERDGLMADKARVETGPKEKARLSAELDKVNKIADAAQADIAKKKKEARTSSKDQLPTMRKSVDALNDRGIELVAQKTALNKKIATLELTHQQLGGILKHFREHPGKCALLPSLACGLLKRKGMSLISFEDKQAEAMQGIREANAKLNELAAEVDRTKKLHDEALVVVRLAEHENGGTEALDKALKEVDAKAEELQKQLRAVVFTDGKLPPVKRDRLRELEDRILRGNELIERAVALEAMQSHTDEVKDDIKKREAQVALLEMLVETFGPDGIATAALKERAEGLVRPISRTVGRLTDNQYTVRFAFAPKFGVKVRKGTVELPIESLSSSERLRIGVALQVGLAEALGFRVLIIDNADMLDPDNRRFLSGVTKTLAGMGYQIIILATDPGLPKESELVQVRALGQ